jgi:Protein of unknown function (DUF1445)
VTIRPDEVPVFWACGVTPQSIILQSRPDFAITHAPGLSAAWACDDRARQMGRRKLRQHPYHPGQLRGAWR